MMRLIAVSLSGLLLAGCFSQPPVTVVDRSATPRASVAPTSVPMGDYQVKRGDTLYRIALEHGLDYRDVAAWNNLSNPSALQEGQSLRLRAPGSDVRPNGATPIITNPVIETRALDKPSTNATKANGLLKQEPKAGKEPYSDEAYERLNKPTQIPKATEAKLEPAPDAKPAESLSVAPDEVNWQWPSNAKVSAMFNDSGSKGIDFSGRVGDPVLAAGDGKVVYAGSGLRGYGELVIVKHNSTYLSAYAHNRKILVAEGQMVKRGQKIAEMGSSDTDAVKLHFEIRKQGKPVDPSQYLPKK